MTLWDELNGFVVDVSCRTVITSLEENITPFLDFLGLPLDLGIEGRSVCFRGSSLGLGLRRLAFLTRLSRFGSLLLLLLLWGSLLLLLLGPLLLSLSLSLGLLLLLSLRWLLLLLLGWSGLLLLLLRPGLLRLLWLLWLLLLGLLRLVLLLLLALRRLVFLAEKLNSLVKVVCVGQGIVGITHGESHCHQRLYHLIKLGGGFLCARRSRPRGRTLLTLLLLLLLLLGRR